MLQCSKDALLINNINAVILNCFHQRIMKENVYSFQKNYKQAAIFIIDNNTTYFSCAPN